MRLSKECDGADHSPGRYAGRFSQCVPGYRGRCSLIRQIKVILLVLVVSAVSVPALAEQKWSYNLEPQKLDDRSMCAIWYGTRPPMLQINVVKDRYSLIFKADQLKDIQSGSTVNLKLPTGLEVSVSAIAEEGIVVVGLNRKSMQGLLRQLSEPGALVVSQGQARVTYRVPDLKGAIAGLKECEAKL